jgi:hypothetical protein
MDSIFFKIIIRSIFFCLITNFNICYSQISESYFADVEIKEGASIHKHLKYGNNIIVGATTFDKKKNHPALIMLDTLGNTIWSTSVLDTSNYGTLNPKIHHLIIGSDGYLYAYCTKKEIWKVDPVNGNIILKKTVLVNENVPNFMMEYDSGRLVLSYSVPHWSGINPSRMAIISKSNCDTISTYYLGKIYPNNTYAFGLDKQKNIYYTTNDTLFKRSSYNFNNIEYKVKHSAAQIKDYQQMYYDSTTNCIFLGGKTKTFSSFGVIVKANAVDGSYISSVGTNGDVNCSILKPYNGSLYVVWMHLYVGSGPFPFYLTKYNMASGAAPWIKSYSLVGVGSPDDHSGDSQHALSVDVSNMDDVYLTGAYGDANYGAENWGILKVNGATGNAVYQKTITEDSIKYNNESIGLVSCVVNNTPYFIGNLETYFVNYHERTKLTFIKLNGANGNILVKKFIGGSYQFPSRTLDIQKYDNNKTLILKHTGRKIELEMYDFGQNLLWKKTFSNSYFLSEGKLAISSNGDIYLTTSSRKDTVFNPYYSYNVDSMYVYKLNSAGKIIKYYQFYIGQTASQVDLEADNAGAMLFYQKSNVIYLRTVTSSSLSSEVNTQVAYDPMISKTKCALNKSNTKAYIFGRQTGSYRMIEINKTSLALTNLSVVTSRIYKSNYIVSKDTNTILLAGSNVFGKEAITYYNTQLKDTIWTRSFPSNPSQIIKCVLDPAKAYLYTISTNTNNILVRKIDIANGSQKWSYTYNGTSNLDDFPIDLAYDSLKGQLIITGYESNLLNKQALILKIDTTGTLLTSIVKNGDFSGDNMGLCVNVLFNGTQVVGGKLNKNSNGLAGFVFDLNSPVYSLFSSFTINPSSSVICNNQSIQLTDISSNFPNSWNWTVNPSVGLSFSSATTQNPTLLANNSGTYTISLIASNSNGSGTTFEKIITVLPNPTLSITPTTTICAGSQTNISVSGADSYFWNTGHTTNSLVVNPLVTTNYSVTGNYINNCSSIATTQIIVNSTPTISVNSGTICSGQSFTIIPNGANTYTYSGGSDVVNPTADVSYSVSGTDVNGCVSNAVISAVTVNPLPILTVTGTNTACLGTNTGFIANGAITYTWNTGQTTSSISVNPTSTTVFTVMGTDMNGCINSETVSVIVDNTCADVWPGDANSDGTADNLDVLELGLHYTQTGAPRASTSNSWQSYFANNWIGAITNGKNLNHSDCNGDGMIDDNDTLAIFNNYGLTHTFKPAQTNTVNPQLSIVPDQPMVAKGTWGKASIYLGDATTPINNINGVAFTVDFDNSLIEPNSIWIEYQNSFMDASQNLYFRKLDFANSKLFTASTHTVSNNVTGFGKIATLHYQIKSSLANDEVLNIGLSQANQSNATGIISPLTSGTGTLMAIGASVGIKENNFGSNVLISPNPTNGLLNISFNTIPQNTKIELYNSIGALVLTEVMTNKNNTITMSDLSSGIYFMKVLEGNRVVAVKKVVKE